MISSITPVRQTLNDSRSLPTININDPASIQRTTNLLRELVDKRRATALSIVPINRQTGVGNIVFNNRRPAQQTCLLKPAVSLVKSLAGRDLKLDITKDAVEYIGNCRTGDTISDLDFLLIHFDALLQVYETVPEDALHVTDRAGTTQRDVGLCFHDTGKTDGTHSVVRICTKDELAADLEIKKVHRKGVLTQYEWYRKLFPGTVFWHGIN